MHVSGKKNVSGLLWAARRVTFLVSVLLIIAPHPVPAPWPTVYLVKEEKNEYVL